MTDRALLAEGGAQAPASGRDLAVWDPLVRLIHWSLALTILINGAFTNPERQMHETVGYIALGLVVTRLLWGLVGPRPARFTAFPPSPWRALRHVGELLRGSAPIHLSHNPLGALMVYNIWGTVLGMAATGIMMGTLRFFGVEWVKELHEALFDWLLISIALHIAGVVFDTWRSGVPLVRGMLTGRKRIPAGRKVE